MAIAQQLQAEGTAQNNAGQTVSVTLGAGSNRYMVVALSAEIASGTQAAPTSVTYGGNALTLITDGSVTASQVSTVAGVFLYRLLEADMPANGANNLVVSWPATTTYVMGWWILTGVNQGNASDVKILAQTTTATSITVTLDAGATTDAVICACYKNDTTGTVAITISGAGVTEDFDLSFGSARGAAGTDLPAVAAGTIACVATVSSTSRRILVAIRLAEAPASIDITGAVTTSAPAVSGALNNGTVDPPTFIQIQSGANGGSANIAGPTTATYLLVVAVLRDAAVGAGSSCTFNGVTMDVANNANDWAQLFYLFNPPEVNGVVSASGSNVSVVVAAQYENVQEFVSGAQGSVLSHSFSPSRRSLMAFCMSSGGAATPLADTEERLDAGGNYYGDRIETAGGTFSVGTSAGTDPDSAAGLFLGLEDPASGEDVTGAVTTSAPAVAGALSTPKNVTGAVSTSSAAVAGALTTPKNVSGAVTTSTAAVAGALQTPKNITGAVSTSTAAVAGSLATPHNITGAVTTTAPAVSGVVDLGITGAVTTSAPAVSGALVLPVNVTGAVTTSTAAVTGSLATPHSLSGAVVTSVPTVAGSLQSAVNITGAVSTSSAAVSGALVTPHNVTGAVSTSTPEVAGSLATPHELTGAVSTSSAAVSGALETPHTISGAVITSTAAVGGSLTTPHSISGAVTTSAPGLTGSISVVDEVDLNGAVSTSSAAVAGALATPHAVSGAVSTSTAAVAGSLETPHNVSGAVTTSTPEVAGSLQLLALLTGALTTSMPIVDGSMTVVTGLSGAVSTSGAAVSGALNAVNAADVTGSVSTSSAAVGGALATPKNVTGAVNTSTPEVSGSLTPAWDITGAVSTSGATVSGAFVTPLGLDGDLQTGGAFVTGSLELPLNISGSLVTAPVVADALLFSVPPQGIPGTATLEVAATSSPIHIRRALALSSVAAAEATIESKDNGSATI